MGTVNRFPFMDQPLVALLKIRQGATDINETVFAFDDFMRAIALVAIPDLLPPRKLSCSAFMPIIVSRPRQERVSSAWVSGALYWSSGSVAFLLSLRKKLALFGALMFWNGRAARGKVKKSAQYHSSREHLQN